MHRNVFYFEGDEYYESALARIRSAQTSIDFMVYIWQDDEIGRAFEAALIEKAAQGILVQLVVDAVGCLELPNETLKRLETGGVMVYTHHKWRLLRLGWFRYLIRRNHRKIIIIDNRVAFTGGFNLMRQCSLKGFGESRWLDIMVETQNSQLVAYLRSQFRDACRRARHVKWAARLLTRSGNRVLIVAKRRVFSYSMSRWLKRRLRHARHRIIIAVPYFVPYGFYWRILVKKLKANVRVEIILSANSDLKWIDAVSFRLARRLLDKGAKVYLYQGENLRRFSHAKYLKIDDWVSTGSANYDYRSLVLNLETMIFDRQGGSALTHFDGLLKSHSYVATREDLKSGLRALLLWPFRWLL